MHVLVHVYACNIKNSKMMPVLSSASIMLILVDV